MLHFDLAQVLSMVVGIFLPVLVGLVTKQTANPGVRAVLLAALSAVSSFLAEWLDTLNAGTAFDVGSTLLTVLGTFVVAVATHFGLWSPTGVSAWAKRSLVKSDVDLAG